MFPGDDKLFEYLVVTDQLDDFVGNNDSETDDDDLEDEDAGDNEFENEEDTD